jgi:hypothetical protein
MLYCTNIITITWPALHVIAPLIGSKTKSSASSNLPIAIGSNRSGKQKNEIYVDILEKLTVLFNSNGFVVNSSIDGTIQMKSFLSGNPELRLALNEDLVIGRYPSPSLLFLCTHSHCIHIPCAYFYHAHICIHILYRAHTCANLKYIYITN